MDIDKINEMVLDILKEISNIGSGNAVTSLAKIIGKKINMQVPQVKILHLNEVTDILGSAEKEVCGVYFDIIEGLSGNILFILPMESACYLVDMLMNRTFKSSYTLNEMELSALAEIGNILAGSYITALSSLINIRLLISPPAITIDMAGALLSVPAISFGEIGDKVLFIQTTFIEGDYNVDGYFFLIPQMDSLNTLFKALGVEIDGK
ncbi:MAG: chemotaxis protein CheC [Thermoanaerobacteraceae bacterium]|nr:chemotaxis protein CheC [Thermoanaerobacteraceae bacterium]